MQHATTLVLFATLLAASAHSTPPSRCGLTEPSQAAAPQTQQFNFLVGDFAVTLHGWTGKAWTPPRPVNARWNGWYGLDGMAVYDEWLDPAPGGDTTKPAKGVNVRLYDEEESIWKMMWVSTSGRQVQDLRAQMRDGRLTMWQVHPPRAGWKAVFASIDADHWTRTSYVQQDDGSWLPEFKLSASRIPCGAP